MYKQFLAAMLSLFFSAITMAQSDAKPIKAEIKYYENKEGAIRGYDPVAYFNESKAVKGNVQFQYEWSGSNWYFKDSANRDAFILSPEKYAPQFGGFCAYGTSENHLSPTDPAAFTIVNNKLYLNYNSKVKEMWVKDSSLCIKKADAFWPALNTQ